MPALPALVAYSRVVWPQTSASGPESLLSWLALGWGVGRTQLIRLHSFPEVLWSKDQDS